MKQNTAGNNVTIKLTGEQRKQIMDATRKRITELNPDLASIAAGEVNHG